MAQTPFITVTQDDIVSLALGKIRAVAQGQTLPAWENNRAAMLLNVMISELRNAGLMLWERKTAYLFTVAGQADYPISDTAASEWALSYNFSTLAAVAAIGATSLSMSSAAGIANGDRIGIILDDGTRFWTTINGTPVGATVTITAGLPSAAAIGNSAYNYTTKAYRPQKITKFFRRDNSNPATDTPMNYYSYDDYQAIPTKGQAGSINAATFDAQKDVAHIMVWQPPSDSKSIVGCICQMPFLQFSTGGDRPDFPQEFVGAIIDGLAFKLHPYYKSNIQERQVLLMEASNSLGAALSYGQETASFKIVPKRWTGR